MEWFQSLFGNCCVFTLLLIVVSTIFVLGLFFTNVLKAIFGKVDIHSSQHGGELVAQVLKSAGVKFVFTLSGGHISPILVAAEKLGIRIVDTRHEVNAMFAADSVARLSGHIGVAAVTAGPGVTNTVTAVKNAQMAESPVLLLGGAAASLTKGRGALQDIDQISVFRSICKYCATVKTVRDIVPTLRKAMSIALNDTPGPVFVEFPIDVLYPYKLVKQEIGISDKPSKSIMQRITNTYLKYYIRNLFADGFSATNFSPLPADIPLPTPTQVQQCLELVSRSKRPVMLLGSQATLPPVPVTRVQQAVQSLGIPCYLGGMSRGLLGASGSGVQCRQSRKAALQEADLVILGGTVCDFRLSYGRTLNRRSKIIAVNRDKKQLYKNSDMFWKPSVAVQADVGTFLVQLQQALTDSYKVDADWLKQLTDRDREVESKNREKSLLSTEYHLNPMKVLYTVDDIMSDDCIIVADGGDFVGTAAYILRPRGPLCWLDPGAFGTLGVGAGFALGAKLLYPDKQVWIIYGDGAVGFSIAEYDTFRRHKTPVIGIIGNDACWQQISRAQVPLFGSNVACGLEYTDYDEVCSGFGGHGVKLTREDNDKIAERLRAAIEQQYTGQGKSLLINCLIGKTDFREGSISV